MCSKQNRRFKSKRAQHDYKNKRIENINKHMSFECKYKFVIQVKSRIMINGDAIKKKHYICEKYYIWNPATCSCKNSNYF